MTSTIHGQLLTLDGGKWMANTEISLERIRNELRRCEENYGPAVIVPDERWEMHACVIRDAMVQMGLDPADKTTQ